MKRKVSTVLDDALFRRIKMESVRQGRPVSDVIGEALESYLAGSAPRGDATRVVHESFGAIPLPAPLVKAILEEEDGPFDA